MLGPNEIGLVGMDGVGGVRLPLTRFRTVRVQQAILPNAEKTHTLHSGHVIYRNRNRNRNILLINQAHTGYDIRMVVK